MRSLIAENEIENYKAQILWVTKYEGDEAALGVEGMMVWQGSGNLGEGDADGVEGAQMQMMTITSQMGEQI